jgi:hypothetical protein
MMAEAETLREPKKPIPEEESRARLSKAEKKRAKREARNRRNAQGGAQ